MTKRDQMNANYAVADALLGEHTGASKGSTTSGVVRLYGWPI